jgi:hypothetical protein
MPEIIKREYRVTQASGFDEALGHVGFEPAGDPEQPAVAVCPVETEEAARALMQSCFEAERMLHPETQPDEFRIERVTVVALDHQPVPTKES